MKQDILVASPYHHTTHKKKQKEQVEKDFVSPIVYIKWQKLHTRKIRQVNKMTKTLGVWAQIVLY